MGRKSTTKSPPSPANADLDLADEESNTLLYPSPPTTSSSSSPSSPPPLHRFLYKPITYLTTAFVLILLLSLVRTKTQHIVDPTESSSSSNLPLSLTKTYGDLCVDVSQTTPAPRELSIWMKLHLDLIADVRKFELDNTPTPTTTTPTPASNTKPKPKPNVNVVVYGDSIIEHFRNTAMGKSRLKNKAIFDTKMNAHFHSALPLGISGDQTRHLLWRLDHGEFYNPPPSTTRNDVTVYVLAIGTNNLGLGCDAVSSLAGIKAVVDLILSKMSMSKSSSKLLILPLLPRGRNKTNASLGSVNRFVKPLHYINSNLHSTYSNSNNKDYTNTYVLDEDETWFAFSGTSTNTNTNQSSSRPFNSTGTGMDEEVKEKEYKVDENVMPDSLHPNEKGAEVWLELIVKEIERILK